MHILSDWHFRSLFIHFNLIITLLSQISIPSSLQDFTFICILRQQTAQDTAAYSFSMRTESMADFYPPSVCWPHNKPIQLSKWWPNANNFLTTLHCKLRSFSHIKQATWSLPSTVTPLTSLNHRDKVAPADTCSWLATTKPPQITELISIFHK